MPGIVGGKPIAFREGIYFKNVLKHTYRPKHGSMRQKCRR